MPDLAQFLRSKKDAATRDEERVQNILNEWKAALTALFDRIEEWLGPAKEEGLEIRKAQKPVTEEALGTYEAPVLELRFGQARVRMEPAARMVIGAYGRVDLDSPLGLNYLVRLEQQPDDWHLVRVRPETKEPLTREALERFLEEALAAV